MSIFRVFGYGSLVNCATHGYTDTCPARLCGWRRVWCHVPAREVALLSVQEAPGFVIDGVLAAVPDGDWDALDAREHAYERTTVQGISSSLPFKPKVRIYRARRGGPGAPSLRHPILLSYLDAVVQGYLRMFGEEGARGFFVSTVGWNAPLLDDRASPRYPRHQLVSDRERAFVDAELAALRARGAGSGSQEP